MKKGTLKFNNGIWSITFLTRAYKPKTIIIKGDWTFDKKMADKKVDFETDSNEKEIIKVISNDKVFTSKYLPKSFSTRTENENKEDIEIKKTNTAFAPYNFIPLNDKVIPGEEFSGHNKFDSGRLSGYIDLNIKTITPVFIRGKGADFIQLDGKPILPGSSLRGLIRNLVEIISYGKFCFFDNRVLFRRMNLVKDGTKQPQAGFLQYQNGQYCIEEAKSIKPDKQLQNSNIYQFQPNGCVFSTGEFAKKFTTFHFKKADHPISTLIIIKTDIKSDYDEDITRGKEVIDIFESAKNRSINQNKIPDALGVPVFFTLNDQGAVSSIGHAKYHREPYKLTVKDHINPKLLDIKNPDFSESIFGTTEIATRVYFEDGCIKQSQPTDFFVLKAPAYPKILSSPKITSYQLYLTQSSGVNTHSNQLSDWNDKNAQIRGSKMYWHRFTNSDKEVKDLWLETGIPGESHPGPINPLKTHTEFISRVRFDNLTKEELGCLLTAIQLPEGCYHKLGLGKSLGLGSVHITASLTIIDRKGRYDQLFAEKGWFTGENSNENIVNFQTAFQEFITIKVDPDNQKGFWNLKRMHELKTMLTWKHTEQKDWLENTRYMEIERPDSNESNGKKNEYKNRLVLPKPSEVAKL